MQRDGSKCARAKRVDEADDSARAAGQNLASQLTPQPQPLPFACGFSVMRKLLPMSSVT